MAGIGGSMRRLFGGLGLVAAVAMSVVAVGRVDASVSPSTARFSSLHEPGVGGRVTAISKQPGGGRLLVAGDMLGVAYSDDDGASWSPSTGLASYEMADFTWDPVAPDSVWVGSMSGPAWSSDGGATFTSMRAGMPASIGYPYNSPVQRVVYLGDDRVLAFGGSQRQWSEDNGHPEHYGSVWHATRDPGGPWSAWAKLATPLAGNIVTATRAGDVLYAVIRGGTKAGVWKASVENPQTWVQLPAPGGANDELSDLAVHAADPTKVWVTRAARASRRSTLPGAIYRSVDGGQTWTTSSPPSPATGGNVDQATGYEAIEAAPSADQAIPVLYVSDVGQYRKVTYRSLDGGDTWAAILTPTDLDGKVAYSGGADMFTLAVDPANPWKVYGGSQEHLLSGVSSDGSSFTWTDLASEQVAVGTWRGRGFAGLVSTRATFLPGGALALNAMDGGNLLITHPDGGSWSRPLAQASRPNGAANGWMDDWMGAVDTTSDAAGQTVYVLKGQIGWFAGVAKSTDGGRTFTILEAAGNGLPTGMDFADRKVTAIQALRDGEVVFTMDGCIWRTVDGGVKWAKERRSCSLGLGDLALDPTDESRNRLIAQGTSGVYSSLDGGRTFKPVTKTGTTFSPGAAAGDGRVATAEDAGGQLILYATSTQSQNPGLWRYAGSATGWVRQATNAGLPDQAADYIYDVAVDPTAPDRVAAAVIDFPYHDDSWAPGVLLSEDGGASWTVASDGLGVLRAAAVAWDPISSGHLVVGTYGQGFHHTTVGAAQPVPSSSM